MSPEAIRQSFDRCEGAGDFAEHFYGVFLGASSEIAPLFKDTDFAAQRKLLRATVYMLITRDVEEARSREALERIGKSHSREELNIRPDLYEVWLDSLCTTVEEMDPEWSDELGLEWRERMRPGIQLITSVY